MLSLYIEHKGWATSGLEAAPKSETSISTDSSSARDAGRLGDQKRPLSHLSSLSNSPAIQTMYRAGTSTLLSSSIPTQGHSHHPYTTVPTPEEKWIKIK
jgi:hypothetical protein